MLFEFCLPRLPIIEMALTAIPWKIVSSLSRVELSARCRFIHLCPQEFCIMKLLVGYVDFPFKATNSPVADKQFAMLLPVSDIADFNLVRNAIVKPEFHSSK